MKTPVASRSMPFEPHNRVSVWEWVSLMLLVLCLWALHILTYNLYPAVWCDEVSFSEPAVNRVLYGSFTTMVWHHQPFGTFPTVNCPLYSMLLVPWFTVTGTELLSARSFNYFLMTSAAVLFWWLTVRTRLFSTPWLRLLAVFVLCMGYGMSYAYRCSRPDLLGVNSLLGLALALTTRPGLFRYALVLLFGALSVWIGLQVTLYAAFAVGLGWFAWVVLALAERRNRPGTPTSLPASKGGPERLRIPDLISLWAGFAVGAVSLGLFLNSQGALKNLLLIVFGMGGKHYSSEQTTLFGSIGKVIAATFAAYFDDFSTIVLLLGVFCMLILSWRALTDRIRLLLGFCLALTLGTPLLFNIAGHYAFYYAGMIYIPAIVACFVAFEHMAKAREAHAFSLAKRLLFAGTIAGATMVGLPLRLGLSAACLELVPRSLIRTVVAEHVKTDDVVFSDYAAFFEAKNCAKVVYDLWSSEDLLRTHIPGRSFSESQKEAVSVLIIRPEHLEQFSDYFGGSWTAVTEPFGDAQDFSALSRLPVIGPRFASHAAQPQTERYRLQIFRRSF